MRPAAGWTRQKAVRRPDAHGMFRRPLVLAAAIAACALAAPASALADCPGADVVPDASSLTAAGQTTLCLLNEQRAAQGLRPLSEDSRLTSASAAYSQRMVAGQFFDHVAPDGSTLVQRLTGVGYISDDVDWIAGENIAWGQGDLSTPQSIVTAWMNSPGHRANILNGDFRQIGLGLAVGSPVDATWGATYTTDFGTLDGGATDTVDRSSSPAPAAKSRAKQAAATSAKKAPKKSTKQSARRACLRAYAAAKRSGKASAKRKLRACSARARARTRR
jgi:uncharacterized protein YkwD